MTWTVAISVREKLDRLKMSFARDALTVGAGKVIRRNLRFSARLLLTEATVLHVVEYRTRDFIYAEGCAYALVDGALRELHM